MRINEILTESHQLDEGPLGAIGRGIGKVVGGAAKGIGAIAGGVVGAGTALKKGYQSGKAVVGDDPDPNAGKPGYTPPAEAPATAASAAAPAAAASAAAPAAAAPAAAAPAAAPAAGGAAPVSGPGDPTPLLSPAQLAAKRDPKAAADPAADAAAADDTARAGEKIYSQVKANIDKLDNEGKTRILDLLKKSIQSTPAEPDAGAAAGGTGSGFNPHTGKPFASAAERAAFDASPEAKMSTADVEKAAAGGKPPNTMANAPVSATNKADPSNPNLATATPPAADADATATAPAGQGAFANVAQQLSKPAKDPAVKAAADAALAKPGFQRTASDKLAIKAAAETKSLVHRGKSLNEIFAQKLEIHKRRMFESALAKGTASVFVK